MYHIVVGKSAEKDLEKLPSTEMRKVENAIDLLASVPRPNGCKKLKGALEDLWRIRVGDYRVIYAIEDKIEIIEVRSASS